MRFLTAAHTDTGITKKINQDAFCLKTAHTSNANICFAMICDGMGGLQSGELASAFTVNAFSDWFESEFATEAVKEIRFSWVREKWDALSKEQNRKIKQFGEERGISLGTTLTAVLIVNNSYIYIQVGDSRIYQLNDHIEQLSHDQTLIAHEIEQNRLTVEAARTDSRQNVLLQCIGASGSVHPEIQEGTLQENDVFLLCSDGFRHEVSEAEFFGVCAPTVLTSETIMKKCLADLTELNKSRKERDNITAILIKAIR